MIQRLELHFTEKSEEPPRLVRVKGERSEFQQSEPVEWECHVGHQDAPGGTPIFRQHSAVSTPA
ncbi:MAG: hypothetical protein KDM81_03415 [Verrucomicrobiae bacterium]|nr:hypothetical protein [Verrucomicrobiae bacterium]